MVDWDAFFRKLDQKPSRKAMYWIIGGQTAVNLLAINITDAIVTTCTVLMSAACSIAVNIVDDAHWSQQGWYSGRNWAGWGEARSED